MALSQRAMKTPASRSVVWRPTEEYKEGLRGIWNAFSRWLPTRKQLNLPYNLILLLSPTQHYKTHRYELLLSGKYSRGRLDYPLLD